MSARPASRSLPACPIPRQKSARPAELLPFVRCSFRHPSTTRAPASTPQITLRRVAGHRLEVVQAGALSPIPAATLGHPVVRPTPAVRAAPPSPAAPVAPATQSLLATNQLSQHHLLVVTSPRADHRTAIATADSTYRRRASSRLMDLYLEMIPSNTRLSHPQMLRRQYLEGWS